MRVNKGVPQRAAGIGADLPGTVAIVVGGRGSDKSNIDLQLSGLNGSGPCTMGAKDHRVFHLAGQNSIAQLSTDSAGLNAINGTVFYKICNRGIFNVDHGAGRKAETFDSQFANCS